MPTSATWKRQALTNICTRVSGPHGASRCASICSWPPRHRAAKSVTQAWFEMEAAGVYPRCTIDTHVTCSTAPVRDQTSHRQSESNILPCIRQMRVTSHQGTTRNLMRIPIETVIAAFNRFGERVGVRARSLWWCFCVFWRAMCKWALVLSRSDCRRLVSAFNLCTSFWITTSFGVRVQPDVRPNFPHWLAGYHAVNVCPFRCITDDRGRRKTTEADDLDQPSLRRPAAVDAARYTAPRQANHAFLRERETTTDTVSDFRT